MIKRQKTVSLVFLIIGLLLMGVFAFVGGDDYSSGLLCGLGTSLSVVGAVRLVRLQRISRDSDRASDYEAANSDERVRYIAGKARAVAFMISIYVQLAAGLLAQLVFGQRLLGAVLCFLVCFQCLLFVGLYRWYSGKY